MTLSSGLSDSTFQQSQQVIINTDRPGDTCRLGGPRGLRVVRKVHGISTCTQRLHDAESPELVWSKVHHKNVSSLLFL